MKLILLKEYDKAICSRCKLIKPKNKYYKDEYRFNGLSSYCIECKRKLNKISNLKYRDKTKPHRRRYK